MTREISQSEVPCLRSLRLPEALRLKLSGRDVKPFCFIDRLKWVAIPREQILVSQIRLAAHAGQVFQS